MFGALAEPAPARFSAAHIVAVVEGLLLVQVPHLHHHRVAVIGDGEPEALELDAELALRWSKRAKGKRLSRMKIASAASLLPSAASCAALEEGPCHVDAM